MPREFRRRQCGVDRDDLLKKRRHCPERKPQHRRQVGHRVPVLTANTATAAKGEFMKRHGKAVCCDFVMESTAPTTQQRCGVIELSCAGAQASEGETARGTAAHYDTRDKARGWRRRTNLKTSKACSRFSGLVRSSTSEKILSLSSALGCAGPWSVCAHEPRQLSGLD